MQLHIKQWKPILNNGNPSNLWLSSHVHEPSHEELLQKAIERY